MFVASAFLLFACKPSLPTDTTGETTDNANTEEVIKIGYVGPLTGDAASIGQDMKSAIEIFLETKNNTLNGKKVEIIYEDGQCNGQFASNAINKLISSDKVKFVLGGLCSSETLAMAPITEQNGVLLFTSGSSNPTIKDAGDLVFRNWPSDSLAAAQTVEDIKASGYKNFAIISENTDFAQGFRKDALVNAQTSEIEVVVDETFNPATTDFKTILAKVKENNAQVLIVNGQTPLTDGIIVKQAAELGIDLPSYASNAVNGKEFFDQAKDATEGLMFYDVALNETDLKVQAYLAKAKEKNLNNYAYAATQYDAIELLYNAISSVGYDPIAVKDWLYGLAAEDQYSGLAGTYSFDANGESTITLFKKVVKNGEFVSAE